MEAKRRTFLTEGVIVAAITLFGYIAAFEFESGFCSYWGIPDYLIDISLITVISANIGLAIFLVLITLYINLFEEIFYRILSRESWLRKGLIIDFLLIFVLIAIYYGEGLGRRFYILLFASVMINLFLALEYYLFVKKPNEEERVEVSTSKEKEKKKEVTSNFYDWVGTIVGVPIISTVLIFLLCLTVAFSGGKAYAKLGKNYLVIKAENLILIKRYGGTYILRKIDFESNLVTGEVYVWDTAKIAEYQLASVKLSGVKTASGKIL